MIARCERPEVQSYKFYGARGIKVCPRWRASYAHFLEDMGRRPSPKHSIDRIDPNGDYAPDNCRWATNSEQSRNKRNNRRLTIDGQSLTLIEWSERAGIRMGTLHRRLKLGWSERDAVMVPVVRGANTHARCTAG